MFKLKFRYIFLASLYSLPLASHTALAQDQRGNGGPAQNERQDRAPRFSNIQRSGYLGRVSNRVILSGNLSALGSVETYQNFYTDAESLKQHIQLWHRVAIDSVALDHTPDPNIEDYSPSQGGPTRTSRALAMVQIAVFDALNSIDTEYNPYTATVDGYENASTHAAVAYAAYTTLIDLYPQQAQRLNAVLNEQINLIQSFTSAQEFQLGQALGVTVSNTIRSARDADGSDHEEPNFGEGGIVADGLLTYHGHVVNGDAALPGYWTPDPNTPEFAGDFNLSLGADWGAVEPFFLDSGDQFRVPPPPTLDSVEYINAYNEVAAIGGASDNTLESTSTAETRFIANYWGYDGVPLIGVPPRVYNQIAAQVADAEINDPLAFARLLALVNTGLADAAIAAWDSKYYYNFWRPVMGIRSDDGVDATVTDAGWNPVGVSVVNTEEAIRATPPFPAYPSGHSTFGSVTFGVLREVFNDGTAFTFVSDEYNGQGMDPFFPDVPRPFVPVRFQSLTEAQQQNGLSRIYNGVHWDFDDAAGQNLGADIVQQLMQETQAFSVSGNANQNQGGNQGQGGNQNQGGNQGQDGNQNQGGNQNAGGGGGNGQNGGPGANN